MVGFQGHRMWIELASEACPMKRQTADRHAVAHRRLAELGGPDCAAAVRAARRCAHLKTEPAIAAVRGLGGDEYDTVARLTEASDHELGLLLAQAQ